MAETKPKAPSKAEEKAPLSAKELASENEALKFSEADLKKKLELQEVELKDLKAQVVTLKQEKAVAAARESILNEMIGVFTDTLTGINTTVKLGSNVANRLAVENSRLPKASKK